MYHKKCIEIGEYSSCPWEAIKSYFIMLADIISWGDITHGGKTEKGGGYRSVTSSPDGTGCRKISPLYTFNLWEAGGKNDKQDGDGLVEYSSLS